MTQSHGGSENLSGPAELTDVRVVLRDLRFYLAPPCWRQSPAPSSTLTRRPWFMPSASGGPGTEHVLNGEGSWLSRQGFRRPPTRRLRDAPHCEEEGVALAGQRGLSGEERDGGDNWALTGKTVSRTSSTVMLAPNFTGTKKTHRNSR